MKCPGLAEELSWGRRNHRRTFEFFICMCLLQLSLFRLCGSNFPSELQREMESHDRRRALEHSVILLERRAPFGRTLGPTHVRTTLQPTGGCSCPFPVVKLVTLARFTSGDPIENASPWTGGDLPTHLRLSNDHFRAYKDQNA